MDRLKGKVALITGAAMGLGEADARLFAQEGAQVILADINEAKGRQVAGEIGSQATFVRLDVTQESEWEQVVSDVLAKHGRLDILVNNAAFVGIDTPESVTEDQYDKTMAVSVKGTIFGCKHGIAAMKGNGGGSIINMSSIASINGEPYLSAYAAAKGAIESYTRAVAVYCAQKQLKIRCNSVHPAAMMTPMVQSLPQKMIDADLPLIWDQETGGDASKNPIGRPIDNANMVLFLASDESAFISGQKFLVDFTSTVTIGAVPGGDSMAELLS